MEKEHQKLQEDLDLSCIINKLKVLYSYHLKNHKLEEINKIEKEIDKKEQVINL